jgi:hypothetical protein
MKHEMVSVLQDTTDDVSAVEVARLPLETHFVANRISVCVDLPELHARKNAFEHFAHRIGDGDVVQADEFLAGDIGARQGFDGGYAFDHGLSLSRLSVDLNRREG